jgi:hypothetical protein
LQKLFFLIANLGTYGVQLFYIVSAFTLLASLNNEKKINYFNFFFRRIIRILPIFYLGILFYSFYLNYGPTDFKNIFLNFLFLNNIIPPSKDLIPGGSTISTEMHFYLILPIMIVFINSYKKSAEAWKNGNFSAEVVPVAVPQRKGEPVMVNEDEEYKNVFMDKIPSLRPAFDKEGTITAANASKLNDGASALILASKDAVEKYKLNPIAKIVAYSDAAHAPEWFTTAPAKAVDKVLEKAGLKKEDISFWEFNEAFSVVPLANAKVYIYIHTFIYAYILDTKS